MSQSDTPLTDSLERNCIYCSVHYVQAKDVRDLERRCARLERALRDFAAIQLTEDNCASFETANARIRARANAALEDDKP